MDTNLYNDHSSGTLRKFYPWFAGVTVSALLFYAVAISGEPPEPPPKSEAPQFIEVVVLPPPPPLEEKKKPQPKRETKPRKIDFQLHHSEESITLLDVQIEPEKEEDLLGEMGLDLSDFEVTMDDVNEFFVFNRQDVDDPPVPIFQPFPKVPKSIKTTDTKVRVIFFVNEFGKVDNPYILESGQSELNSIVLETLKLWRYEPAKKNGVDVRCWVRTAIIFSKGGSSPFSV